MTFANFKENRFRIDGEIAENHAILVNLTASIYHRLPIGSHWTIYYDSMVFVYIIDYLLVVTGPYIMTVWCLSIS